MPRFYAHFNRAMGKYYHCERDLTRDMKERGLEFVPKGQSMENEPRRKSYSLSAETREIVNEIKNQTRNGKFKPSGRLLDILAERSKPVDMKKVSKLNHRKGGFTKE